MTKLLFTPSTIGEQEAKTPDTVLSTTSLPVMEQFYTIQGEGFHQGKAAVFIRLGGCTVGCHWCDVKESWDASKHPQKEVATIVAEVAKFPATIVVITGGEPLIYNLDALCKALQAVGKQTHIETSGAYPLSGSWDWICLSPKKFKFPLPNILPQVNELKVVVFNKTDLAWAEQYAAMVPKDCLLFLQPEWSRAKEMLPFIVEYVKAHPEWRISIQAHKYMEVP